jgi:hypothetical protein
MIDNQIAQSDGLCTALTLAQLVWFSLNKSWSAFLLANISPKKEIKYF